MPAVPSKTESTALSTSRSELADTVTVVPGEFLSLCVVVLELVADESRRKHIKPQYSQTILLPNVYSNPAHTPQGAHMSPADLQANFDAFYEDFFM